MHNIRQVSLNFKPNKRYYYYYMVVNDVTFMCLCDNEFSRDTAFIFLDDVSNILFDKFTEAEIRREKAYSQVFTSKLCPILKEKMAYYNSNPEASDSLRELKKNIIQFKDEVLKAHDLLMQREEKIALIVKKADSLKVVSGVYYNNVSILYRNYKRVES